MNEHLLSNIVEGIQAGSQEAIRQARLTNTNLAVWRDGKIAEITPDEAEAMMSASEEKKDRQ